VKGVALLIYNHPDRSSDQWMWRPQIGRDQRVALQDRSARFFGTDFSFEDLEERDVDQFEYKMLGDDTIDGAARGRSKRGPNRANLRSTPTRSCGSARTTTCSLNRRATTKAASRAASTTATFRTCRATGLRA
jgi:hypothetical protein